MKKIVRLTESDLVRLVKRVINEAGTSKITPSPAGYYYYQRDSNKYFGDPLYPLSSLISPDGTIQSQGKDCFQPKGEMRNNKQMYTIFGGAAAPNTKTYCGAMLAKTYGDSRGYLTIDFGQPKTSETQNVPYQR